MALWNRRPFNSAGPNPFGGGLNQNDEGRLAADSVKCPSCGSNIVYEPELSAMMCRNCGNIYSPETLEPRGSLGITKEHDYMGDSDMSEDDKKRHEIVCNSCGAALIADENTMSTMCPFCGSPALITRRMSREFKPDYIVPFKIDKDQAKKNMMAWLATKKYTPIGFKSKSKLTNMTALYVPFWLLDCVVHSDMSGTGKVGRGNTKTIYEVNANMVYHVKGVPFDASVKIANRLMEAIEPFDYKDMVKFESKYLQGFYADKYEQLPSDMTERITRRISKFSRDESDIAFKKYDQFEKRFDKGFTWISDASMKYCLLPVWFMTVEFEGDQYQFAVNGQTGEASGQVPNTSAIDNLYWAVKLATGPLKWFPIAIAGIIFYFIWMITNQSYADGFLAGLLTVLIVIELILVTAIVGIGALAAVAKIVSSRMRKAANEINDYDEDPGLDAYLDSTKHTDFNVEEKFLRHVVLITDDRGNIIGERSIEV